MLINRSLLLAAALVAPPSLAIAQSPPTPATPPAQTAPPAPQASSNCVPTRADGTRGSITTEGSTTSGQAAEPLGDKLAKSDGVLCPPSNVDPAMRAPAPEVGKMPVIPPPGTPGSQRPNADPK